MSDVLNRLRSIQNECAQYVAGSDIMREAADEIERQQQRIRELESINAVLVEAAHAALDFGLDQRSKRGGWARSKIEAALAKARGESHD